MKIYTTNDLSDILSNMSKQQEASYMYLNNVSFRLTKDIVEQSRNFATNKKKHNSYYVEKRNADASKTYNQDAYSKACEFEASKFVKQEFGLDYPVNTEIYCPDDKNWDADLGQNIAVKSTSFAMRNYVNSHTNGKSFDSWTFQYRNNDGFGGLDKKIFGLSPEEQKKKVIICAITQYESIDETTNIFIKGLIILKHLHDYDMFKDPIKLGLIGIKKCIYDNDLKILQSIQRNIK